MRFPNIVIAGLAFVAVGAGLAPSATAQSALVDRLRLPAFEDVCVAAVPDSPVQIFEFAVAAGFLGAMPASPPELGCTLPIGGWAPEPGPGVCISNEPAGGSLDAPYVPDLMDEIRRAIEGTGQKAKIEILDETDGGYPTHVRFRVKGTKLYFELEQRGTRTTLLIHYPDGQEITMEYDGNRIVRITSRTSRPARIVSIDLDERRAIVIDEHGRLAAEVREQIGADGRVEYVLVKYEYDARGRLVRVTTEKRCGIDPTQ